MKINRTDRPTSHRSPLPGNAVLAKALLTLACVFTLATSAQAFNTIIIDPGHGAHDLGASDSLVYEKHINLDVSRRLERTLREMGFRTVMTRADDTFIPLDTRSSIANRYRNAVFVSVHFNSSYKNKVTGIETFYRSSESKAFADLVQRELIRNIGAVDRGVKTANFSVIKKTQHPCILVEGGFISNAKERNAMTDPRYRQAVADSIARGIVAFHKMRTRR
ncbi:MAG: N-acetylmuramoyl-L-alanine amidase [Verrucomicrobiae bacterium]|nr:N-acetylmuramoyl-L-alanine amidase [Verrucomicrobiae bacterium]